MFRVLLSAVVAFLLCVQASAAAEPPKLEPAEMARLLRLRDSLTPLHGEIPLPEAHARLRLGAGYYFLGPADARRVLVEGWGNSPDDVKGVLGLVFPVGGTFIDSPYGAVVTYDATAYVSDADAKSADYAQLLKELQAGEDEDNASRRKAGYDPVRLVGWAQPPTYDAARHDLIWARDLQFGDRQDHTLNYDVRHLGRRGVLSLNMVSTMSKIAVVRAGAQDLARTAEFDPGSRYSDFKRGDKTAGYSLAGLVAAGAGLAVAKKAGLLVVLLAFAKKGLVLLVAGVAAMVARLRKALGLKGKASSRTETDGEADAGGERGT